MNLGVAGIFLFLGVLSLSVTGGFITHAASEISNIPNYEKDDRLSRASTDAIWASVLSWLTVTSVIVLIILYIVFTRKKEMGVVNLLVIYGLFFISLLGVLVVTILSIATATHIGNANLPDDEGSHTQATWSAILGSLTFVILLATLILIIYFKFKKTSISDMLPLKTAAPEVFALPAGENIPIQVPSGNVYQYNRELGKQHARGIGAQMGIDIPDWLYDKGEKAVMQYLKMRQAP